mgnify:CR=1 FL=1
MSVHEIPKVSLKNRIKLLLSKENMRFVYTGVFLLAAAVTFFIVQQRLDIRQRASDSTVVKEGELRAYSSDDFQNKTNDTTYVIRESNGTETKVQFSDLSKIRTSDRVVLQGSKVSNSINAQNVTYLPNLTSELSSFLPDTLGKQKVAVVLVNFEGNPLPTSYTKQDIQESIANKLADYFREVSNGKSELEITVYDWLTLPSINSGYCTGNGFLEQQVVNAIDSQIDFTSTKRLLILQAQILSGTSCRGNYSTIGKITTKTAEGDQKISLSYVDMTADKKEYLNNYYYYAVHELLHAYGLGHSNALTCDNNDSPLELPPCASKEYGDNFDASGNTYGWQLNTPHRLALGWLDPSEVTTVTKSGRYFISPIESPGKTPRAIRILLKAESDRPSQYLYAEYRQPLKQDILSPEITSTDIYDGALLHIIDKRYWNVDFIPPSSILVDASPESKYLDQPSLITLRLGAEYKNSSTQTTIKVVELNSSGITFQVTMLQPTSTPTPTLAPASTPLPTPTPTSIRLKGYIIDTVNKSYSQVSYIPGQITQPCQIEQTIKCDGIPKFQTSSITANAQCNIGTAGYLVFSTASCPSSTSPTTPTPTKTPTPTPTKIIGAYLSARAIPTHIDSYIQIKNATTGKVVANGNKSIPSTILPPGSYTANYYFSTTSGRSYSLLKPKPFQITSSTNTVSIVGNGSSKTISVDVD